MSKSKISRPSMRSHRAAMLQALKERQRQGWNIWSFYSPKAGANLILAGDPEYFHAHLLEGDPSVESFEVGGDVFLDPDRDHPDGTVPDAIVKMRGSTRLVFREVKAVEEEKDLTERDVRQRRLQERVATNLGMDYERIGPTELKQHATLINNWRLLRPAIAAAQGWDLGRYMDDVQHFVLKAGRTRLRSYFTSYPDQHELRLAGLLRTLQTGQLHSDLDRQLVTYGTWLWNA